MPQVLAKIIKRPIEVWQMLILIQLLRKEWLSLMTEKRNENCQHVVALLKWFLQWKRDQVHQKHQSKAVLDDKFQLAKIIKSQNLPLQIHNSNFIVKILTIQCQYLNQHFKNSSHQQAQSSKNPILCSLSWSLC